MESLMLRNLNGFGLLASAPVPQQGLLQRKAGSVLSPRIAMPNSSKILNRSGTYQPIGLHSSVRTVASIKDETIYQRSDNKQLIPSATSTPVSIDTSIAEPLPADSDHISDIELSPVDTKANSSSLSRKLVALYHFTRFYTVIGTVIGVTSVSLLAVQSLSDISPIFFIGLLQAIVPAVLMNIYIVAINQLIDVEIDKVNKPYLPIASGEFSQAAGVAVTLASVFLSLGLGLLAGSQPLNWALYIGLVCGTAYSVEISVLGRPPVLTAPLIFSTAVMSCITGILATVKDLPDVEGDRLYGIKSLSISLGRKRVFWTCVSILLAMYSAAMVVGATSSFVWTKVVGVLGHGLLATLLWRRARSVDIKSQAAFASFYMFVWKLFYAEYLLIPFLR
eukprot:Gb_41281 [translate_table: standard]